MVNLEHDFVIDSDLKAVLEFMQANIEVCKLIGVAEAIPSVAKLLWQRYQQESFVPVSLASKPLSIACGKQPVSIG